MCVDELSLWVDNQGKLFTKFFWKIGKERVFVWLIFSVHIILYDLEDRALNI